MVEIIRDIFSFLTYVAIIFLLVFYIWCTNLPQQWECTQTPDNRQSCVVVRLLEYRK